MSIRAVANAVILSWGWRRAAIAFVAGAVSVLALAPFDLWPVLFLTFPVAVWLIDGSAAGRLGGVPAAAIAGWFFGLGYGARVLAPLFARPSAWRILDIGIGIVMWSLAARLVAGVAG